MPPELTRSHPPLKRRATVGITAGLARAARSLSRSTWILGIGAGYFAALLPDFWRGIDTDGVWGSLSANALGGGAVTRTITALVLLVLVAYLLAGFVSRRLRNRFGVDADLAEFFAARTDPILDEVAHMGISWGSCQTVTACPDLSAGWTSSDVRFSLDTSPYRWSTLGRGVDTFSTRDLSNEYETFRQGTFSERYSTDARRLTLTRRPTAFSDQQSIRLDLRPTRWSQLQFFWSVLLTPELRKTCADRSLTEEQIAQPNSLCLHLIVQTDEGQILLTRAPATKRDDHPSSWAASLGEQIDERDIAHLDSGCLTRWVARALHEELFVADSEFDDDDVRALALIYEGEIANFALVTIVRIALTSTELERRIKTATRPDNEFSDTRYVEIDEIPGIVGGDMTAYHPTSGIRLLYAYIHKRSQIELRHELARALRGQPAR